MEQEREEEGEKREKKNHSLVVGQGNVSDVGSPSIS